MPTLKKTIIQSLHAIEEVLDHAKFSYKWRFDRWKHLRIQPYRGYGTPEHFHVMGRVLDDKSASLDAGHASVWDNVVSTVRRIDSDEVPGATLRLHYGEQSWEAETDSDGYFDVEIDPGDAGDVPWQDVAVELVRPDPGEEAPVRAHARILVPRPEAEYGIISDLDDTVIRTGATDRFSMTKTVLLNNARSRVPFPGVAEFYRALQDGPDGKGLNPIFYVSSSPWNLYSLFNDFMEAHGVPPGPIFLKDFGLTENRLFKSGHQTHKLERIRTLLETYPHLPFILIGDSGQKDAEIYRQIVHEQPERIRAVFIRDVTPRERALEIRDIAHELDRLGVPMVLAEHTAEAARQARALGLILPEAVRAIADAVRDEEVS